MQELKNKQGRWGRAMSGLAVVLGLAGPLAARADDPAARAWTAWLTGGGQPPALDADADADAAALLRIYARGVVVTDDGEQELTESQRRRAAEMLETYDGTRVRRVVGALDPLAEEESVRARALEWLAPHAGTADVPVAVRLAAPDADRPRVPAELRRAFRAVAVVVGARADAGVAALEGAFPDAHEGLLAALVDGIGAARTRGAIDALAGFLRQVPELDPVLLSEIARVAEEVRAEHDSRTLDAVRRFLDFDDAALRQGAARAASSLGDDAAVPGLLALVADGDANVRRAGRGALRRLTGLRLGDSAEAWAAWYEDELEWWRARAPRVLRELEVGDAPAVAAALLEVSKHVLRREELAEAVASCLERSDRDLVATACAVLGRLRSPAVVERLVRCWDRSAGHAREAARSALVQICGSEEAADDRIRSLSPAG